MLHTIMEVSWKSTHFAGITNDNFQPSPPQNALTSKWVYHEMWRYVRVEFVSKIITTSLKLWRDIWTRRYHAIQHSTICLHEPRRTRLARMVKVTRKYVPNIVQDGPRNTFYPSFNGFIRSRI